jgi:hypothetical protein
MAEMTGRCFDMAWPSEGPQTQHPRDCFYGEITCEIRSRGRWRAVRVPRPRRGGRPAGQAKFPVIVAGGVMYGELGRGEERRVLHAPSSAATCTTTASPPIIRCGAARWARGSRQPPRYRPGRRGAGAGHATLALRRAAAARSRLLAQDGPRSSRSTTPHAGLVKADLGRHLRRCQGVTRARQHAWPAATWPRAKPRRRA